MRCVLTALSWHGDLPLPGQYIKAPRGRTAFLVLSVISARPGLKHVARFVCERENPARLSQADVVYAWRWSARRRRAV